MTLKFSTLLVGHHYTWKINWEVITLFILKVFPLMWALPTRDWEMIFLSVTLISVVIFCIILFSTCWPICILNSHHTCHIWIALHIMPHMTTSPSILGFSHFIVLRLCRFRNLCPTNRDLSCLVVLSHVLQCEVHHVCVLGELRSEDKCILFTALSYKIQVSET